MSCAHAAWCMDLLGTDSKPFMISLHPLHASLPYFLLRTRWAHMTACSAPASGRPTTALLLLRLLCALAQHIHDHCAGAESEECMGF